MDGCQLTSFLYLLLPLKPEKANVSLDTKAHARNAASHGTVEGSIPAFPAPVKTSALKGQRSLHCHQLAGRALSRFE